MHGTLAIMPVHAPRSYDFTMIESSIFRHIEQWILVRQRLVSDDCVE